MKKCLILFCLLVLTFAKAQLTQEFEVNFETASHHLSDAEAAKFNNYLEALVDKTQTYKITIIGHTDNVGNLEYNKVLSDKRAAEVAKYFRNQGFPQADIRTLGKAYAEPIAANSTETGKSKNRRVSVFITSEFRKVNNLGGLQLKEDTYSINAQKEEVISYKSGSKITIPSDAFADENGNTVTGKVDLTYVEYRNPVDFILGNIPMDFGNEHFNSAGMYKILAYKDGKPVFLRNGKTIDIDFPLESELPDLNFYNFDTISNKWTELSKLSASKNEIPEKEIPEFSADTDTVSVSVMFVSFGRNDTIYTDKPNNCWSFKNMVTDGIQLASTEQPTYPEFICEQEQREANRKLMQENYQYNKTKNIRERLETQKAIKSLEAKIKRNNLKVKRIKQLIKNSGTRLTGNGKIQYVEHQTKVSDSILGKNKFFEDKLYALKNPAIDTLTINPNNLYPNRMYAFAKSASEFMSNEEKLMTMDQWYQYFDDHKPEMLNRYKSINIEKYCTKIQLEAVARQQKINTANQTANRVTQKLQIAQLGIFNCDQIARLLEPIAVNATYKNESGETINPMFIYLVDSRINGILRYNDGDNYSPKYFAYSPRSENTLLAFDGDGTSYILNSKDFSKSFNGNTTVVLTMKKIENIKDREALTALF